MTDKAPVKTPALNDVVKAIVRDGSYPATLRVSRETYDAVEREMNEHRKRVGLPVLYGAKHGGLMVMNVELLT